MKLSLIIAPLIAAKVPHDVIMETVLAFEAQQTDALEKRREADRNRQAKKRSGDAVTLSHVTRSPSRSHAGGEDSSSRLEVSENKKVSASPSEPKRATRLPADWVIPDEWLDEAIAAGLPRQRALSEAERMKNWSLSNKNGAKLDWRASWRNWFRDKIEPVQPRSGSPPGYVKPRTVAQSARQELERLEEYPDAPSPSNRYHDHRDEEPGFAGTGIARRIAIASSR